MSLREFVVLGTASQVPTRYRNHNGYLLRFDEEGILFDPGEGTQRQMIYADVTASQITKVCITHFHGDHCLGFAGISQRLSLDRVPHPIDVYFPASGQVFYDRLRKASIYHNTVTQRPHPIKEAGVIHEDKKLRMLCAKLDHGVDCYGYRLEEKDRVTMLPDKLREAGIKGAAIKKLQQDGALEVEGKVIRLEDVSVPKRGQKVAFVMDTRPCAGAVELARDVDVLVIESTYLESERDDAGKNGHMTAKQAATIAKEAGAKLLVLTHFSQRYPSTEPFVEEAGAIHDNVVAARDGKRVPIPRDKR